LARSAGGKGGLRSQREGNNYFLMGFFSMKEPDKTWQESVRLAETFKKNREKISLPCGNKSRVGKQHRLKEKKEKEREKDGFLPVLFQGEGPGSPQGGTVKRFFLRAFYIRKGKGSQDQEELLGLPPLPSLQEKKSRVPGGMKTFAIPEFSTSGRKSFHLPHIIKRRGSLGRATLYSCKKETGPTDVRPHPL